MKRGFTVAVMLAVFFFVSYLCSSAHAAEAVIKLSYASYVPPSHKIHKIHEDWGKEIEKRTSGRVKVTYYPAETLVQGPWTYDGVVKGIADIGHCTAGQTRGLFPLLEVLDLPLGQTSGYQIAKLGNVFIDKFKPKELDEVHFLFSSTPGPFIIHTSKKPVNKLEDLKGLKIRAAGPTEGVVRALGATPVAMPVTETYDAVQKGVVDGVLLPTEALLNYRIAEVTTYTTNNYGAACGSLSIYIMNKKKWDALPPDIQKIFTQVAQEHAEIEAKFWNSIDKDGEEFALKKGHKFISVSKEETARWTERMKPAYDQYVNNTKAKGLPGAEALQFCKDYIQKNP
jgi:TRAP-type C4-dicarboxylate transport system substrate-binding protein